ncbi:50S ribosomal protein L17 [Desulfocurvus vexinensis]|uniref:50S ribosomal protein L17 n=1 Tax=Desulfocurvus vexinensis TaxID=399548 RepID=UPI0004B191F4|nr:50S ribosomal protein L17 [Desulfocurvus vexinensis]
MRHRKSGRKFNRTSSHRKAMFRNMAKSLIVYGRIRTTETRAKELRGVVERLVRFALQNDVPARREAYKVLGNHSLVKKLFDEIGPLFAGVPGGYTRVLKLGLPRTGDSAPMAVIEFSRAAGQPEAAEQAPAAKPAKPAKAPKAEAPAKAEPAAEEKAAE